MKVALGDVCRIQNGYAFDSSGFDPIVGVPLIRIRDLKTNAPSLRFKHGFDRSYLVTDGDLLVGMDGEFECYRWQGPDALLNQRVCRLEPDPARLDAAYLRFAVREGLKEIEAATPYTTVRHLSSKQIKAIRLPLPPLPEQNRIALELDAQMALVERARAAAEAELRAISLLPAALLREVFGDEMNHG